MAEPPRSDDTLSPPEPRPSGGASVFAKRLERYLALVYAAGEEAAERHDEALRVLRESPAEIAIVIARALGQCHSANYPRRWALIYAATRLEHAATLPLFRELVLIRDQPQMGERVGHRSTAMREETILKTTAIDGVARLAERGDEAARDLLFEVLDMPSFSVRRAAVQALVGLEPDSRRQVAERLPSDHRFLLDITRIDVREASQVRDPSVHLRDAEARGKPSVPALDDDARRGPDGESPTTRGR